MTVQTDGAEAERQLPGWMTVDPTAVVRQLSQQLAGLHQQLAMKDAYIDQLLAALAQVTADTANGDVAS